MNHEKLLAAFVDIDAMDNSGVSGEGGRGGASDFNMEADDEEEDTKYRKKAVKQP